MDGLESEKGPFMKKCYFCQGSVKAQRVTHVHRWDEQLIILEDVPAEVCQQCGEVYFALDALQAMDRLAQEGPKEEPKKQLLVPVYSLSEL